MGLPLLVASTDNKLDLCLGLEDCFAPDDEATHTSFYTWYTYKWRHHMQYFRPVVCVCVCIHTLSAIYPLVRYINPNQVQQEFNLKLPMHTHMISVMIHTLSPHRYQMIDHKRFTAQLHQNHDNLNGRLAFFQSNFS